FAASNVLSGNVVPCVESGFRPTSCSSNVNSICQTLAAARSTASVAAVISGEMPSPFSTQRRTGDVLGVGIGSCLLAGHSVIANERPGCQFLCENSAARLLAGLRITHHGAVLGRARDRCRVVVCGGF